MVRELGPICFQSNICFSLGILIPEKICDCLSRVRLFHQLAPGMDKLPKEIPCLSALPP